MKKIILALAVATVAVMAVVGSASAEVARYQSQTATFTATTPYGQVGQWEHVWKRDYTVTLNPCDNTFTGTGKVYRDNGDSFANETISGTFTGNSVSFTAGYAAFENEAGFSYTLTNAPSDGNTATTPSATAPAIPFNMDTKVTPLKITGSSTYKNHGEYVSSQTDKPDAAHSCIGMPIH